MPNLNWSEGQWLHTNNIVYSLQNIRINNKEYQVNRFQAHVSPGINENNELTPNQEIQANTQLMASAKILLAALINEIYDDQYKNITPKQQSVNAVQIATNTNYQQLPGINEKS